MNIRYISGFNVRNIVTCLLPILSLLLGCTGSDSRDEHENVFRYNQISGITSLDPAFARNQANNWVINQLFNGLLQFDDHLNIQPAIAKSYTISDDGLIYTFTLRDDVFFHNNDCFGEMQSRRVVAADFVYSFNRIIDEETASPGAWIFNDKVTEADPFVAIDDTTFVVNLIQPFRPMISIFTMQYCSVVAHEAIEKYGKESRKHPVGTGPFQIRFWIEDEALVLEKNPLYFEFDEDIRLPYLDEVVLSFIESKSTEFLTFMDGDLDFVSDIDASLKDLILDLDGNLRPEYKKRIELLRAPFLNTEYLGFIVDAEVPGMSGSPVLNRKIRQAINYGFDRKEMIRYLRNSKGIPGNSGIIPFGLPSFDTAGQYGYNYNPEKAKELLAEAGFPNGEGLRAIKLYAPPTYMDICEYIQNQLRQIGINIEIEITQSSIVRNLREEGKTECFRASWIADYPDEESFLAMFYSKYGTPPNYTRFSNSTFDALYEQAVQENNDSLRAVLYTQMDSLIMAESPVVPLYYDEVYRFVQPGVIGLETNPMNLLVLKNVRFNHE